MQDAPLPVSPEPCTLHHPLYDKATAEHPQESTPLVKVCSFFMGLFYSLDKTKQLIKGWKNWPQGNGGAFCL